MELATQAFQTRQPLAMPCMQSLRQERVTTTHLETAQLVLIALEAGQIAHLTKQHR